MGTSYPDVLQELQFACARYRGKDMTLDDFKTAVWKAATAVVSADERELRELLQRAEGELDLIQFTTDDSAVHERALAVVHRIETIVERWR